VATLSSVSRSTGWWSGCGSGGLGVDADDLTELADDHELAGLVDGGNVESLGPLFAMQDW
jgi:hypothetical protein